MYTDYEFYTDVFYGDMISEDKFPKWSERASEKLDYLTMNRIDDDMLVIYSTAIQKAVCALAEVMCQIDTAMKEASDKSLNGNIASRSSGGESVTYASTPTLITTVLADKKAQENLMFDTVRPYLSSTGLLFQGI